MKSTLLLILMALLVTTAVQAQPIGELLEKLKRIESDPAKLEIAVRKGKDRALLCAYCHGNDGNSVKDHIPNLAGQNAKYLLTQFDLFATGKRQDFVMSDLAKNLSDEERVNIILYFARNPVKRVTAPDSSAYRKGEEIYQG